MPVRKIRRNLLLRFRIESEAASVRAFRHTRFMHDFAVGKCGEAA
jgi:hypothetical protein